MTALMKEAGSPSAVLVPNYRSTDTAPYPKIFHALTVGIVTVFRQILSIVCKVTGLLKDLKTEKILALSDKN